MKDYASYSVMELVNLLVTGDPSAFTALYERYFPQLYLHAYNKLADRETAKDIVQDLFTRIWEKRAELQITGSFSSYLYTATRNRVLDHIARSQTRDDYARSLGQYIQQSVADADYLLRARQMSEKIANEIEALPERLQKILELSRTAGLSHKEIAVEMNLSEQTVKTYVKEGLKILRRKLTTLFWSLL